MKILTKEKIYCFYYIDYFFLKENNLKKTRLSSYLNTNMVTSE